MKTEPLPDSARELWATSLTIREAIPEDSGQYLLHVENGYGQSAETAVQLTVQGKYFLIDLVTKIFVVFLFV